MRELITVCPSSASGPRVLLVEPHRALREALVELLRSAGMTVTAVADPDGAVSVVRSWRPTVAVVDPHAQHTREHARVETLAALHACDPGLPLVVHSAMFAPGTLPRPERFHAVRIVPKGSDPDELLAAIRQAHERAGQRVLVQVRR